MTIKYLSAALEADPAKFELTNAGVNESYKACAENSKQQEHPPIEQQGQRPNSHA